MYRLTGMGVFFSLSQTSAVAVGMVGGQALFLGSQYWLAQWASKSAEEQEKVSRVEPLLRDVWGGGIVLCPRFGRKGTPHS